MKPSANPALRYLFSLFALCFVLCYWQPQKLYAAISVKKLLAKAKPGQTVRLPSGTFIENVIVPPGVSLRGANARKTVIVGSIQLAAGSRLPVSLSRITLIHTGGRTSRAVDCQSGNVNIHNTYLVSEGGFATVGIGADSRVLLQNNIIVGPVGDYAIFGRNRANVAVINNTIVVQGFGIGLMDKSFAAIRNCLFFGDTKPAVIRTDSDYSITYSNISLAKGSFYFDHELINDDVKLRDSSNYPNNATPADLTNRDFIKYDGLGLTFFVHNSVKFKGINEYRKNTPKFALHVGSPNTEDANEDGSRNNLGAFGGSLGSNW